jgi:hypothetical protein
MSDNVQLNRPVTAGVYVSTEEVGGIQIPRTKILIGAAGVDGGDVTSSNPLPVTVVAGAGVATAANQTTEITKLTSIDGKLTACNTGAVVVSSSALPTGAATESTLSTLNGKITACNTGAVVVSSSALPSGAATSAAQTTGNTSLSSIDGKITACNTGAVVVSSSALPSGAATSAAQTTGNTSLSSIDGKITACDTGAVVLTTGSATIGALVANQSVNLSQVAGSSTATGHGTASGALRVELPTDGTGVVGLNTGSNIVGQVGIDQTTSGTTNLVAIISGQNGVAGGSGTTSATVQRVVLATDTTVPNCTGNIANNVADSGNPIKIGTKTVDPSSLPTFSAGRRADMLSNLNNGCLLVQTA